MPTTSPQSSNEQSGSTPPVQRANFTPTQRHAAVVPLLICGGLGAWAVFSILREERIVTGLVWATSLMVPIFICAYLFNLIFMRDLERYWAAKQWIKFVPMALLSLFFHIITFFAALIAASISIGASDTDSE